MPRANRYFLTGYIWHITHRCHKREYLLNFVKDRQRWIHWLFEAKKRFDLIVLDYMVTSNHIHLLVFDNGPSDVIPKSMQLVAGRTGQEYNQRKKRKGAYWEDRYHATAISSDQHLWQCIAYIDSNMVRAGVVSHPDKWQASGYNEIQNPKDRYTVINYEHLKEQLGMNSLEELRCHHKKWVDSYINDSISSYDSKWSESIAVGNKSFVDEVFHKLGNRARKRKVTEKAGSYLIKEPGISYNSHFGGKMGLLRAKNEHFLKLNY